MLIKIHKELLTFGITGRVVINKYYSNRAIKAISMYAILKSISTSGIIHNYTNQAEIYRIAKISRNNYKTLIRDCAEIGLLKVIGKDIKLSSWMDAVKLTGKEYKPEFITIDYDLNKTTKLHYYFYPTEISIKKSSQESAINNRLKVNSTLKVKLDAWITKVFNLDIKKISFTEYLNYVMILQDIQFQSGAIIGDLYSINPDCNRNASSLKKDWNFKSTLSITYWKRKLQKLDLIDVNQVGGLLSTCNNRLRVYGYADTYCKVNNMPVWYRNDRINVKVNVL